MTTRQEYCTTRQEQAAFRLITKLGLTLLYEEFCQAANFSDLTVENFLVFLQENDYIKEDTEC